MKTKVVLLGILALLSVRIGHAGSVRHTFEEVVNFKSISAPGAPLSGDSWNQSGALKFYNGSATRTVPFTDGPTFTGTLAAAIANFSGVVSANDTTQTTSVSTGGLVTAGGLGVAKAIIAAGPVGVGTSAMAATYSAALAVVTATSAPAITLAGYGSSQLFNQIVGYASRGTEGSPTTVQADDFGIFMGMKGYVTGTGWISGTKGTIGIAAEAIWTASSTPTYISFYTTPVSSITRTEAYRINSAGLLQNKLSGSEFAGSNQSIDFTGSKGPAGVTLATTANPTKWLKILDSAGAAMYIPAYQ